MELTAEGLELIDESIFHHVNLEEKLLNVLTKEEKEVLNPILRKIGFSMEEE